MPIKIGDTTVLLPMYYPNNGGNGGETNPTVIIVLFIIIAVIGIAAVGWLLWESFKD